jgi:predicted MFS family arabinose efflux permease
MSTPEPDPGDHGPWYRDVTPQQWLVLTIASAGWIFDVYEGQLFTIFKTPMFAELLGASTKEINWHANVALALFLLGGAVGGLGFGMLADRMGRIRVMSLTILAYSIFSGLTFFARNIWDVNVLRFLVALGTGGEWAVAAALVAETFPVRARTFASGIFHASSVLGGALASATGYVLSDPHAWRYGFLVGLAPALLILWIQMSLSEPERWKVAKRKVEGEEALEDVPDAPKHPHHGLGSVAELLGDPRWRFRALLGLALASVGLGTYWGIFAWGPELARDVLVDNVSPARKQEAGSIAYMLMNFTGGLFGLLGFAPIAARWGRRYAFMFYHLGSLVMVPVTFLGAQTYAHTLGLLPVMAFFVVGMHAGYAIYFPELFPTRLRATGSSFCFNLGRLGGAGILLGGGALGNAYGLRHGVVAVSSVFLVGLILLWFAPETKGQQLPE